MKSQYTVDSTRGHVKIIKEEIDAMKRDRAQRKGENERRRNTLLSIQRVLPSKRADNIGFNERKIERGLEKLRAIAEKSKESRAFLAREAASLYGLNRSARANKKGDMVDCYFIGGTYIPDLREINSMCFQSVSGICRLMLVLDMRPDELTTVLTHVAHLLVLASHYLAVRLPAEITVPHRAYPLPTILTPEASYSHEEVAFPVNPYGSGSSPASSRRDVDARKLSGTRPLYVNQKVQLLVNEDSAYYNRFIEGVSLLAWNIAWLCRTQGLSTGTETWQEICCIGKNLFQLLCSKSDRHSKSESPRDAGDDKSNKASRDRSVGQLGQYTHDSAKFFLGTHEGREFVRGWKFSRYALIVDNIRKTLSEDIASKEWEVLNPEEIDEHGLEDALLSQSTDGFDEDEAIKARTQQ
ncbi:MAG: hypothetical protein Q9227_003643 [Pyrenula ochraceoflavens]